MNLSTKQKQTHRHREQTQNCQDGKMGVGLGIEIGGMWLADSIIIQLLPSQVPQSLSHLSKALEWQMFYKFIEVKFNFRKGEGTHVHAG